MEEVVHCLLLVSAKAIIDWLLISAALAEMEALSLCGGTPDLTPV